MDHENLRESLHDLDAEIERIDTVDDETRAALQDLAQDIQMLLARTTAPDALEGQPLRERLSNSITYYEITHPQLSASISRVLDALVQLGL